MQNGTDTEGLPEPYGRPEDRCVFPMVGRVDYRSNWVPAHFMRRLFSIVGAQILQALGLNTVELWRCRALARSFRYGVAFAYQAATGPLQGVGGDQVYDIAQAQLQVQPQPQEEQVEDDPAIDDVRHIPPEQHPQVYFNLLPPEELESDTETSMGTSNFGESTRQEEVSDEEDREHEIQLPTQEGLGGGETPGAVTMLQPDLPRLPWASYRAVDGALIVIYLDDEFRIELPGWSFEEIHAIVECIQRGEWSLFHEIVGMGTPNRTVPLGPISEANLTIPPGVIALGSLDPPTGDGPSPPPEELVEQEQVECQEALPVPWVPSVWSSWVLHLGQGWWVVISGVFLWGLVCCFRPLLEFARVGEPVVSRAWGETSQSLWEGAASSVLEASTQLGWLLTIWALVAVHRLGVVLVGSFQDPPGILLEVPGIQGFVHVPFPLDAVDGVWVFLVVLLGLLHPAAAIETGGQESHSLVVRGRWQSWHQTEEDYCPITSRPVEETGGRKGDAVYVVMITALWETFRRLWCWLRRRGSKVAATQTEGGNYVPLPLEEGMPHRAHILFSLWRGGYSPSVEEYPLDVQEEYHRLVGVFLQGLSRDEDSSD